MNHARPVDLLEGFGDARHQHERRVHRQRTVRGYRFLQGRPGHERCHQPGRAGVRIGIQYLRGVEAVHPARGLHFLPEAMPEIRMAGEFGPDHLQRYRPAARSEGQVHGAHATRAKPGVYPVPAHLGRIIAAQRFHVDWLALSAAPGERMPPAPNEPVHSRCRDPRHRGGFARAYSVRSAGPVSGQATVVDVIGEVEHDAFGVHAERGGDEFGVGAVDQAGQAGAAQSAGRDTAARQMTDIGNRGRRGPGLRGSRCARSPTLTATCASS